jgi:hypothetical protein
MFAPIVILFRHWFGSDRFLRLRGQAIALHAQIISQFCDFLGIDRSQRQRLIRMARDNGKRLGFMA